MKEIIPAWMQAMYDNYHFSPAIVDGDHLRCSGMIGMERDFSVPDDPERQFTLVFENLQSVLAEVKLDLSDIVEMTTFHVDLQKHLTTFVAAKDRFMSAPHAAWTAIGITELALPGALVEVRVTARLR